MELQLPSRRLIECHSFYTHELNLSFLVMMSKLVEDVVVMFVSFGLKLLLELA